MSLKLFFQAITKVTLGIVAMALFIFGPAGTVHYWQGWLLMAIMFVPMIFVGFFLMFKNPGLLQKRLNMRESESEQKQVILFSAMMFIGMFITAGFAVRFSWYILPAWVSYFFALVFFAGYILYAEVLKENEFLSRTIEIQENQKVVDTGLYGVVRHPMYMATLLLFLAMPLILGSIWAFLIALLYIPIIKKRILNEEKVLEEGLEGYIEYEKKVRYHLIPYIW